MKKANYIDLHSHSKASTDGTYSGPELIDIAIESGIRYYAISDHDFVSAIDPALEYAQGKDITVIPAIEISTIMGDCPLHLLGYGIDHHDERIQERSSFVIGRLMDFAEEAIRKCLDYGFLFDPEVVYSRRDDHLICEEFLGEAILDDPRNDNDERLSEFRYPNRLSDSPGFNFYKEFFAKGKPLYIPYHFNMPIEESSRLIHACGGKMFLAHPAHNIRHDDALLKMVMDYGLDGIEVFSSYHTQEDTRYYYEKAKEYGLLMSVGSDFHGDAKPTIRMGSIDYDEDEIIKTLKSLEVY